MQKQKFRTVLQYRSLLTLLGLVCAPGKAEIGVSQEPEAPHVSLTLHGQTLEEALETLAMQCDVPMVAFLPAQTSLSLLVENVSLFDVIGRLADQSHLCCEHHQATIILSRPLFIPPGLQDYRLPSDLSAVVAFWQELPVPLKADLCQGKAVDYSTLPETAYRSFAEYAIKLARSAKDIGNFVENARQKRSFLSLTFRPQLLIYDKEGPVRKGDWVVVFKGESKKDLSQSLAIPWIQAAPWATVPLAISDPLPESLNKPVSFAQPAVLTLRDLADHIRTETGEELYVDHRYADERVYLRTPPQPAKDLLALVGRAMWLSPRVVREVMLLVYDVPRLRAEIGKLHEENLTFLLEELQSLTMVASESSVAIMGTPALLKGDVPVHKLTPQQRAILEKHALNGDLEGKLVQLVPAFQICIDSELGNWRFEFK